MTTVSAAAWHPRAVAEAPDGVGQRAREPGVALAGHRRVHLGPHGPALDEERGEREGEEQDAERRRAALVELGADDREEDLGRQHTEVAAQHDRVAEVGDRLDEADQERVREAGAHQRQRDRRERRQRLARSVCAASSIDGETPSTTPISTRKAIGVKANTCASSTPW